MSLVRNTKIEEVFVAPLQFSFNIDVHPSRVKDRGFVSPKEMKDKM